MLNYLFVSNQQSIKKLKKMRADASNELGKLEKSSADTWDSTKHGFTDAYKDLHDAYKEAAEKIKQ